MIRSMILTETFSRFSLKYICVVAPFNPH